MGTLTRAQIVTQGLQAAGRQDITTFANTALNAWLRKTYRSWPWPFLRRRNNGKNSAPSPISLAAGTQTLLVGNGNNGITTEIGRFLKVGWLYTSDYARRAQVQIRADEFWQPDDDPDVNDPTKVTGIPNALIVRPSPVGQGVATPQGIWQLTPWPVPDTTYLLILDYFESPADITSDTTIPYYPNDETMIQAVKVAALDYMKAKDEYAFAINALNAMSINDRLRWGGQSGMSDNQPLDPEVHR